VQNKIQFEFTLGTWLGFILLAVFSVGLFGASMVAFHPQPTAQQYRISTARPNLDSLVSHGQFPLQQPVEAPPPVNTTARDEIKQGQPCIDCQPIATTRPTIYQPTYTPIYRPSIPVSSDSETWQDRRLAEQYAQQIGARLVVQNTPLGVTAYATISSGLTWSVTGGNATQTYSGVNAFKGVLHDMQRGFTQNAFVTPNAAPNYGPMQPDIVNNTPAPSPRNGRPQITLFVGNDSKSQALLHWFQNDPTLSQLRSKCAFEVLRETDPMYQARLSSVISPKDFPAIIFAEGDGAHIYAAGGPMLPTTSPTLYSDLKKAWELKESVKNAPPLINAVARQSNSGLIKQQGGYNWDRMISPNLQLVSQPESNPDCPDGNCPLPSQPNTWTPGQRIRDGLFPTTDQAAQAMLWTNGQEIATVVFAIVAVALVFAIFRKLQG
jgi:hypothetical protein